MMLYVLHDKYTIIDIKISWRENIPSSSRLVWKLASPNRYVVRADVREKGFSTHSATYRGVNLRTMSDGKDGTLLRGRHDCRPQWGGGGGPEFGIQ